MSLKDKIYNLRKAKGMTQQELADVIGVTRATISQWETGFSKPRLNVLDLLADALGTSSSALLSDSTHPRGALSPVVEPTAFLPLRGTVHAGKPQDPETDYALVALPKSIADAHPNAYFLVVEGDCMDRVYPEGCMILVDPTQEPHNGSIAAVSIDGTDFVMRRLYRTARTLVLSPESYNEEHTDIIISGDDHEVELCGTVVWFQSAEEME